MRHHQRKFDSHRWQQTRDGPDSPKMDHIEAGRGYFMNSDASFTWKNFHFIITLHWNVLFDLSNTLLTLKMKNQSPAILLSLIIFRAFGWTALCRGLDSIRNKIGGFRADWVTKQTNPYPRRCNKCNCTPSIWSQVAFLFEIYAQSVEIISRKKRNLDSTSSF